jgi:protein gp37
MAQNSAIQWTDSTFNPWVGCIKVSPGCKSCYAESFMTRKPRWADTWGPTGRRLLTSESNWKKPLGWNKQGWLECQGCGWRGDERESIASPKYLCPKCEGEVNLTRQRVFCASLADVFEDNPQLVDWREGLFDLIQATPNLDWLLLTKRPENVNRMVADMYGDCCWLEDCGKNIWIGASVEDQQRADERIPALLDIPARIRFLSIEPLLGPIDLEDLAFEAAEPGWAGYNPLINWAIIGGESGPNAREFKMEWAHDIVSQCQQASIPVFVKQMGDNPTYSGDRATWLGPKGKDMSKWPEPLQIRQFPKVD